MLIQNGFILDSSANPWIIGDVGIEGNKIAGIGERKMTSMPAQVLRIRKRGMLREGMYADIVATFAEPHQYGRGLSCVIVNGELVVEDDAHTERLTDMVIYGPGKKQEA